MRVSSVLSSTMVLVAGLALASSPLCADAPTAKAAPTPPKTAPAGAGTSATAPKTAPAGTGTSATPPKTAPAATGTSATPPKTAPAGAGTSATPPKTAPAGTGTSATPPKTAPAGAGTSATAPKTAPAGAGTSATPPKDAPPPKDTAQAPAEPVQTPKEKADALLIAGRKLVDAHEAEKAVGLLEEAHGILQDPESGFELVRAYEASGKVVESLTLSEKLQALPPNPKESAANADARKKIKEAAAALATRVSTVRLQIQRPAKDAIRVKIDEKTLLPEQLDKPIRVNAGKHEIMATAPGYEPLKMPQDIDAANAREYPVTINMTPIPVAKDVVPPVITPEEPVETPMPMPVKVGIIATSALGAISIGTAIGAGVVHTGVADAYNSRGCANTCQADYESKSGTLQGLSWTSLITGVAAVGVGTFTIISARKTQTSSGQTGLSITPTPGGFVAHGRF